jgi:ABC-type nickel/cobalt efflux system permease component RcnA
MILEGLLAGAGHVVSGPDHLVGVAPLAVERSKRVRPALVGATWGLGHGIGVAILGVLGQTILSAAQVDVASGWAERLVGIVLIVLGLVALRRAKSMVLHEHEHAHDGDRHVHLHVHGTGEGRGGAHSHGAATEDGHGHNHAAFGIGVVHGLAGAGHFWAVLPSLAMPPATAAVYIGSYVLASLLIMTVFGAVLGRIARSVGVAWLPTFFRVVGALTLAVGVWWTAMAF